MFFGVSTIALLCLEIATLVSVILNKANVILIWLYANNLVIITECVFFGFYVVWCNSIHYDSQLYEVAEVMVALLACLYIMFPTVKSSWNMYALYVSLQEVGVVLAEPDHLNLCEDATYEFVAV